MKKNISLILLLAFTLLAFKAEERITIFMVGDSTMAGKPLAGGNPERGWGQMLPGFLTGNIRVENHAVNGRSTKSFIDEGRWNAVTGKIKPGDYVFIQFGHNDQKADEARHTDPSTTYQDNLKRFVSETRAKGGIPVLFTPVARRHFDAEGQLADTHGEYPDATRRVATDMDAPLIDLNRLTHDWVQQLGDSASRNYFMWIAKNTLPCCPEGKEDDTHLNVAGAKAVAKLAVSGFTNQLPALSPYIKQYDFVVAKDGSGDFFTVQDAINAVPDYRKDGRTRIRIRTGIYKEKLIIPESKINVSLIGDDGVIIQYDDFARKKNIFGEEKSTSGSSTCYFYADNLYAGNITFQNTSGPVGQAVAVMVAGDRTVFKRCRFLGFQDTLYTYGMESRQYYEDCYIEGTVDFIFGWSTAVFNRCTIHSNGNGYLTAPSTPKGKPYGYVFFDCRITAAGGVGKVYLSRPWRPFAKAVFIRCDLGAHILPEGWHNWGKVEAEKTIFYAEYESTGQGANPAARAAFSHQLKDINDYAIEKITGGTDGWNPLIDKETLILTTR